MALFFVLLLIVLPLVEIWTAVMVAGQVGGLLTLVLLISLSLLGAWLIRREGTSAWKAVQRERLAGGTPTLELVKGTIAVGGALLLIIPGFVTAALGLLLLIPPVRSVLARVLLARMSARAAKAVKEGRLSGVFMTATAGADGRVRGSSTTFGSSGIGEVIDSEGWDVVEPAAIAEESSPSASTHPEPPSDDGGSTRPPSSNRSSASGVIDID